MKTSRFDRVVIHGLLEAAMTMGIVLALAGCKPDADQDGVTLRDGDCDDGDPTVFPDAPEACDGIDNDCDEVVDEGLDADGDGHLRLHAGLCPNGDDCDDHDDTVHAGAPELCDEIDHDCDGSPTGGLTFHSWWPDLDEDGFGTGELLVTCDRAPPDGYASAAESADCDDEDPEVFPGATDSCNAVDDDCDGLVDEPFDQDRDGYVDGDVPDCVSAWLLENTDCDDDDVLTFPGAPEICDGTDNNCNDSIGDEEVDGDGDGRSPCDGDCNDLFAAVAPGADEVCDGLDSDCDGVLALDEIDADADHFLACADYVDHDVAVLGGGDCDAMDAQIHPGASEVCDAIDQNCDGVPDETFDDDLDGATLCGPDGLFSTADDDCDDADPEQFPANPDVCDGEDNDCDGLVDELSDEDGDGFTTCGPDGLVGNEDDDCDDHDAGIKPYLWDDCDGLDVNCNGLVDEDCDDGGGGDPVWYCYADADGDGWGGSGTVVTTDADCDDVGESGRTGDCDDGNPAVSPSALETPNNGVDEDCDGADQQSTCDGSLLSASEGEPNNSSSQTNLIVSSDGHLALGGAVTCGAGGDHDWFSVSFGCGGPVTFDLDALGSASTLQFEVTGSASASGSTTASTAASPGSMVIHVWCSAGPSTTWDLLVDWD